MRSAQVPCIEQSVCPCGHAQLPETHDAPLSQTLPQPPQLFGSFEVSTQPPLFGQLLSPDPQTHAMTPPTVWQEAPAPQTTPHAPQLKLSMLRLTQEETPFAVHVVGAFAGQPHMLLVQTPPTAHALPHVPQLLGSLVRSKHPFAQAVFGAWHTHMLFTHASPIGHTLLQVAQWAGSLAVLVQTEPQRLGIPAGQLQFPPLQVAPTAQGMLQPPQLFGSVSVSVHMPLHIIVHMPPSPASVPASPPAPVLVVMPPVPVVMPPVPVVMPPVPVVLLLVVCALEDDVPPWPPPPELLLLPQPSAAWASAAVAPAISHVRKFIGSSSSAPAPTTGIVGAPRARASGATITRSRAPPSSAIEPGQHGCR
jgi:hypothetical protein